MRPSLQQRLPGAEGPPEGCSTAPRHAACGGPLPSSAEGPCERALSRGRLSPTVISYSPYTYAPPPPKFSDTRIHGHELPLDTSLVSATRTRCAIPLLGGDSQARGAVCFPQAPEAPPENKGGVRGMVIPRGGCMGRAPRPAGVAPPRRARAAARHTRRLSLSRSVLRD